MSDDKDYPYPHQVCREIQEGELEDYEVAATYLARSYYDILSVQHEYGIFGGESGAYLMNLVRRVNMPIVTTLHTVLDSPSPSQKAVMDELLQLSERVIVMTEKAVGFLIDIHGVPPGKIDLIPHGIPKIDRASGLTFRSKLGIDGPMILTFGLLSPDKGIQYVIEAMPKIVAEHPRATYVVVGATHPHVKASIGEAFRESLMKQAADLGIADNVRFVDRFVTTQELVEYLGAMDVYVTPYLNPKQITSGTLAYAVGAGKAVISTPYWYAEELLADGRGHLVPFRDADAIAEAILDFQRHPEKTETMARKAAEYGNLMQWPTVANQYLSSFSRAKDDSAQRLKSIVAEPSVALASLEPLPKTNLDHLFNLSDDTGIIQHATYSIPNRAEGYCVDDNARALLLTAYLAERRPLSGELSILQSRYLGFVLDAFNPQNGRFRNFMSFNRTWLEEQGSEDSHGRALWAVGTMINRCGDQNRHSVAKQLFMAAAPAMNSTASLRTWAYGVLACDQYLRTYPHDPTVNNLLQILSSRMWRQYEINQSDEWPWFEQFLTYANARLPQALILAGNALGNHSMQEAGLDSLSWLMNVQRGSYGVFAPIGSDGFYRRNQGRNYFDQQPIEAWCSVSACLTAGKVTGNPIWIEEAYRAFAWFTGENMLGIPVYDAATGGCCDGLHTRRINKNQGAESTLSFLCALTELQEASSRPIPITIHEFK